MKKIAVLGGGGTGCTMAADLTLKGYEVSLYEERTYWKEHIDDVMSNGNVVKMSGQAANGTAKIHKITDHLEEVIEGAEVILIAVIALRHQELAQRLAPALKEGQTVCFSAGNCGSLILKKELEKIDKQKAEKIIVGEMQGNIYPCRFEGKCEVKCALPYMPKKVAAFPAKDTERLIQNMKDVYPMVAAKNVFETTFNSPNISIHLAGSLLNTGMVEKDPDYRMYHEGLTPAVLTCIKKVEEEKQQVMEKMGYEHAVHAGMIEKLMQYDKFPELDDFRMVQGPSGMRHRYIHEDASTGQILIVSLGEALGCDMTCMKAFITLAGIINGTDYMNCGKDIKYFGLESKTPEEINTYLETGEK